MTAQAAQVAREIHRPLGIVALYRGFTDPVPTSTLDTISDAGSLPLVNVKCGGADAAVASGARDDVLRAQAQAFMAYGRPVLYRWFWEMNLANEYAHSVCLGPSLTAAAEYVAAWDHIRAVFRQVGATNVAFVWAPSAALYAPNPQAFFPGPDEVDWIGADMYDRAGYRPFPDMFQGFYARWSPYRKPMILTETGAVGSSDQAGWLPGIATSFEHEFPLMKGLVYVDAVGIGDYVLTPGTSGFAAFAKIAAEPWFEGAGQAGYTYVTASGGAFSFDAPNFGGMAGRTLSRPVVGVAATPDGGGYWLVASDGGIFAFGDASSSARPAPFG